MTKSKYNLICVRHLQDQNVLKSYGLNGPLVEGQEEKVSGLVQKIKSEIQPSNTTVRILYSDKSLRIKQTVEMIAEKLESDVNIILDIEKSLDIFDQGELLLPDNYTDGEHFDPLMQAWDAISEEAYTYRNIDYRFGEGCGFKQYPTLAKSFLKNGESFVDLLIRKLYFVEYILKQLSQNENELLVVCTQDLFILLLKELQGLIDNDSSLRPEELMFDCWKIYKEKLQNDQSNDHTPFGDLVKFDLSDFANPTFIETITLARKHLENRKSVTPSSIQGILNITDNDFSEIDTDFKKETGIHIDSVSTINPEFGFYPISVVIPYYNSRSTILDVLRSIELQNLTKKELSNVEVIIVNDGWKDDLGDVVIPSNYSFDVRIITCKENGGRSVARNIGARNAKHDILMFLDADNLVSGECLREHSIRNKIAPDHLYTSLVANVFLEDVPKITNSYFSESKPLPKPDNFNEFRVKEEIKSSSVGIHDIKRDITVEILKETDNFRKYGFGRMVAYYDLPSMYATYCVSVTKTMFQKIGGFSEKFKGWGMEDSFFGAIGIVRGAKIIPILSCGSYSVNLPSHSGSEEKEKMELKVNVDRYNKFMRDSFV